MLSFYRFLLGFVRIFVFGVAPERFINYCASNGISVWNIKRKNDGIYLNIGLSDYKNLREIRRKIDRSIRVRLQEKHGLVFISKKVIKRPGLITGIAMFFIINIAFSQFIWNIDIVAPNSIDKNQIISVLSELGVSAGVPRQSIDTYNLSQLLALRIDNIAWVSLNVEGSNLTVNISVATESEKNPENTPSNIVASFDGVIKSAEIIEGKKEFLLGQAVRKGDLLVSGVISDDANTKFVHSKGEILADTQRVFSVEVMKDLLLETEVNRTQYRSILKIFWLEIPLYLHDVDGYSDSIYNVFSLKMFEKELPIQIVQRKFVFKEKHIVRLSKEESIDIALYQISESLRNQPIVKVNNYTTDIKELNDRFLITVSANCTENIAVEQQLKIEY